MNDDHGDSMGYDDTWDAVPGAKHCGECGSFELSAAVDGIATCMDCGESVPLDQEGGADG